MKLPPASTNVSNTLRLSSFEDPQPDDEDWHRYNAHFWRRDWPGFAAWFVGEKIFSEPPSTKPIEDGVGWGLDTTGETLALTYWAPFMEPEEARELAGRVRCPVLVIHGEQDAHGSVTRGIALAEHAGLLRIDAEVEQRLD